MPLPCKVRIGINRGEKSVLISLEYKLALLFERLMAQYVQYDSLYLIMLSYCIMGQQIIVLGGMQDLSSQKTQAKKHNEVLFFY